MRSEQEWFGKEIILWIRSKHLLRIINRKNEGNQAGEEKENYNYASRLIGEEKKLAFQSKGKFYELIGFMEGLFLDDNLKKVIGLEMSKEG